MMKIGFMALASLAFVATGVSATAAETPFARDKAVLHLDGLDLATVDGQQRLSVRMDQVARTVCGENLSHLHLSLERKAQDCRAAVVADIRTQIETRTAEAPAATPVHFASAR